MCESDDICATMSRAEASANNTRDNEASGVLGKRALEAEDTGPDAKCFCLNLDEIAEVCFVLSMCHYVSLCDVLITTPNLYLFFHQSIPACDADGRYVLRGRVLRFEAPTFLPGPFRVLTADVLTSSGHIERVRGSFPHLSPAIEYTFRATQHALDSRDVKITSARPLLKLPARADLQQALTALLPFLDPGDGELRALVKHLTRARRLSFKPAFVRKARIAADGGSLTGALLWRLDRLHAAALLLDGVVGPGVAMGETDPMAYFERLAASGGPLGLSMRPPALAPEPLALQRLRDAATRQVHARFLRALRSAHVWVGCRERVQQPVSTLMRRLCEALPQKAFCSVRPGTAAFERALKAKRAPDVLCVYDAHLLAPPELLRVLESRLFVVLEGSALGMCRRELPPGQSPFLFADLCEALGCAPRLYEVCARPGSDFSCGGTGRVSVSRLRWAAAKQLAESDGVDVQQAAPEMRQRALNYTASVNGFRSGVCGYIRGYSERWCEMLGTVTAPDALGVFRYYMPLFSARDLGPNVRAMFE